MVVAQLSSVVPALSVAVPLVLSALPPALVVVASVAVGSSGWWSKQIGRVRETVRLKEKGRRFIKEASRRWNKMKGESGKLM